MQDTTRQQREDLLSPNEAHQSTEPESESSDGIESALSYRVIIPDDTLIEFGVMPGDTILIEDRVSSTAGEAEYIGKLIAMAGPNGILIGRYEPPYLIRSFDRTCLLSELEIVGLVWG